MVDFMMQIIIERGGKGINDPLILALLGKEWKISLTGRCTKLICFHQDPEVLTVTF
jgi:hypothetical protein